MANFVVTTLNDELDSSSPTATLGQFGGANDLSLREALVLANRISDTDTITFAASLSGGTLFLTQSELTITSNLTIDGDSNNDGTADITISADSAAGADDATSRVFHIGQYDADAVAATLDGLVIRDGIASFGGGIYLDGAHALTLVHSRVLDNTASRGGGIFGSRGASITLEDSAVSGNVASGGGGIAGGDATWITLTASTVSDNRASAGSGGGIAVGSDATITLADSTLSGNRATLDGGGISGDFGTAFTLTNATVVGNAAADDGGGIYGLGQNHITLTNATVTGNSAGDTGGGIYNWGADGITTLTNSIVAGNAATGLGDDLYGGNSSSPSNLVFAGGNILGSAPVSFATTTGAPTATIDGSSRAGLETVFANVALIDPDGSGGNPALYGGVAGNNGGPVATVALRDVETNLALDGGDDTLAAQTDARGLGRVDVAGIAHNGANASDIGAFELQVPFEAPSLFVTTLSDVVDPFDNLTSLREALALANGDPGADTITFAPDLSDGTLFLNHGELAITSSLAIDGDIDHDGAADITISADSASGADDATSRVFSVSDGAAGTIAVTLHGLEIRDGVALDGGAIFVGVADQLTLSNATVSGNSASGRGGGIGGDVGSSIRLQDSTLSDNRAVLEGGGVFIATGAAVDGVNVTIADNAAGSHGGGLYGFYANDITLTNATVTGNSAGGNGGGINAGNMGEGNVTSIANSIIAGNQAGGLADDLYNEYGGEELALAGGNIIGSTPVNLIVTGAAPVTIDGASEAALHTVFAEVALVDPDGAGSQPGFYAGVLGDNGGPVATVALRAAATNPALDGGTDSLAPFIDARGLGRVDVAGAAPNGANVSDIGAFELQGPFEAPSFVVTTLTDVVDPFDGLTSLREALVFANRDPGADRITFAEDLAGGTLFLPHGELAITTNVTIDGDIDHDGTADVTISANSAAGAHDAMSRVFSISDGADSLIFVELRGLTIRDGRAEDGGAISVGIADQILLSNTTVSDSTASRNGGAVWVDHDGLVTVQASIVRNNHAAAYGGGLFAAEGATVQVINATVAGNAAGDAGGGIFGLAANPIGLLNATVTGNSGGNYGGGVASVNSGEVGGESITIANSIVAGNRAHVGNDLYNALPGGALQLAGGNIIGSAPVNFAQTGTAAVTIDGASRTALQTVFANVALVDPDGAGGSPSFWAGIAGDHGGPVATVALRSALSNPAIDGGSDLFATGHDARGLGRVDVPNTSHNDANVSDIGAFELQGPFEPASFVVTTLSDVLDLSDGLTSLREALALANSDPDSNTITFAENLSGGTLRLAHGELVITTNVTVDGDIGHDDTADITISADSAPGANDATSRVFSVDDHAGTAISAGLRGLVIRDGFADNGGAIFLGSGDQLTLTNTTVSDNTASRSGGGIWTGASSQLWLDRSTVSDNHAARDGGGIYLRNSAAIGVFNSTVADNSAGGDGGGIYGYSYNAMTLVNATVTGNSAGHDGGGLYTWGKGFTSIANSIIAGNEAGRFGDDLYNDLSSQDLAFAGGNIIGSAPVHANQIGTAPVVIDGASRAALQTVFADVALVDPDGASGNPAFYAGVLDDNGGPVETVAIRTNGLAHDTGGNAALGLDAQDIDHDGVTGEPLPFDARDLARVINRVVDIGAFEIQNSDPTVIFNDGLMVAEGTSGTIRQTALFFIDAEETDITYTVTALPLSGILFLGGTPLAVNDAFTQGDINHGRLSYTHDGSETHTDSFAFEVSDGVHGTVAGQTFQFSVNNVNDAPGGNLAGGIIQYIEDQAPTALDPSLTVTDPDDTHLEGARVAITGNFTAGQDVLGFTPQFGIAGSYNAGTGALTLTGHALLAEYETVLRSVTYSNTSQNPADAQRTVSFQVDDGGGPAPLGSVGITVIPQLDPPNDINGDHTSDIVLRSDGGTVRVLEMDGVTVLGDTTLGAIPTYWHIVDADGDFNGDGRSDILWRDDAGVVVLWTMDGGSILTNTRITGTFDFAAIPDYWHIEDTGDFTGDGRADLLWRDDAGRVVLWEMNGPSMVRNSLVADVPTTSHIEATADLTGDGRADILWHDDDGTLRIWEMNGASVVSDTSVGTVADTLHLAGTGDFNRDGRFDLLWRDDDGTVRLWEMDGANTLADTALGTLPAYWQIADVGDYTGDLNSDILWRDTAGTIVLWEMDGPTILDNTAVNTIPTNWHVVG